MKIAWQSLSLTSFFQLLFNSNVCLPVCTQSNAQCHSTCVNVLMCSHYGASKDQKRKNRYNSSHSILSNITFSWSYEMERARFVLIHLFDSVCIKYNILICDDINLH